MKISFNPSNSNKNILDLIKNNKDIIFDLKGHSIFARGVEFKGTDTNTWRPVVDNLTSDSTTSSLSAKQGKVLKALIDGKSNSDHNHDGRYVYNYGGTAANGQALNQNALFMSTTSGITGDWWHILQAAWNDEYRWNSQIAFPTQNRNGMYYRSGLDNNTKWGSWVKLLDTNNYSSTLDSRYYTESEVNSLLDAKLNRQNLSYGTWNPRGYNLAADYFYNGGDLSISESGGQIHVSVDGYFWQNEGRYRVLDTSDINNLVSFYGDINAADDYSPTGLKIIGVYGGSNTMGNGWGSILQMCNNAARGYQPNVNNGNANWYTQIMGNTDDKIRYRTSTNGSGWTSWKTLLSTADLQNINVASATKLQTARRIWGQSFDGTADVDNTLRIRHTTGNYCEGIRIQTGDGAWSTIILGATSDSGTNTNAWSIHRKSDNNFAISRNSPDGTNGLVMTSVGMGLGTTSPTQRLDVNGNIRTTGNLYISHATNNNMNHDTSNPRIVFSGSGRQDVGLVYTDYDSYRASKGLKVMDVDNNDPGNVWFEVQGYNYSSGYVKNGSNNNYVLLGGGGHKAESSLSVSYASSAGSATSATKVIVNQHTTSDTNYPLVWSNQTNTSNVTENQLFKSWADLYYNPKNKRLTVGGSIVTSSFIKSGGNYSQLLRADGGVAAFNWAGQSGQPTWLWGGNDFNSYYVYNPSNFRVAYAASAGNAETLGGMPRNYGQAPFNTIPCIGGNGVMEIGRYIDYHYDNSGSYDFSTRLQATGNYKNVVNLPSASGTLALTSNILNPTDYYWANVKISTSSSTTTSPTVSNLTATNSIKMGNILLEYTDEINNITNNGSLNLNCRNSGDVSLCAGGGKVGIGTRYPAHELYVMGYTNTQGFGINPYYLSDSGLLPTISPGDGYTYRCLEIGRPAIISCIIADKTYLPGSMRGVLLNFKEGFDGQLVLLKDLQNYGSGNGYFWVMPSRCKIIKADGSSILIGQNQISNIYDDGHSRFFIYSSKYSAWIEFLCS